MERDSQPRMVKPESPKKPKCKLVGKDGNVFNLTAIAAKALKKIGQHKAAKEMATRVFHRTRSYDEALCIIMEYVDTS